MILMMRLLDAGCSGSSGSDVDISQLTLDDGQLCPAELEQALQGDSLLLMACSAGYYQLAQVHVYVCIAGICCWLSEHVLLN